ncbi:RNA-binding domain-containing protein [Aggregatilineales bacterium SYSU G02658]
MANRKNAQKGQWYRADLHVHTPASLDYKDKNITLLDILHRAEYRGIDIIALTDHNSVGGYAAMVREIERLEFLEQSGRTRPEEDRTLMEYRRLSDKMLVLPGFEFTATFGFHILGIFPPGTSVRMLEHVLLSLNVPPDVLDRGDPAAGSTADVLDAYQAIDEAGGLAIAAHINSAHGVMMRGLNFGGQTRIAYTQDKHLAALELTDLSSRSRASTRKFFDGTKPEYPRRMHLIQGSDAHSLDTFLEGKNVRYGVGERATELNLRERSFDALRELFASNDFSRTRPYASDRSTVDFVLAARDEGQTLVQSFHETLDAETLPRILADTCAFANTSGGTIYIGLSAQKGRAPLGVTDVQSLIHRLTDEINRAITPALEVDFDTCETLGKTILRLIIPFGEERPYALNDSHIYIRDDGETELAVRDEIVNLVRQGLAFEQADSANAPVPSEDPATPDSTVEAIGTPRSGVEIAEVEERGDTLYFTMRDLRNGSLVKNVTIDSARRLWHYAIKQYTGNPIKPANVEWRGNVGLARRYEKGGEVRYDLVQRDGDRLRVYYGVTEAGMQDVWEVFLPSDNGAENPD